MRMPRGLKKTLQKFASVRANVHNHLNLERHLVDHAPVKQRRSPASSVSRRLTRLSCQSARDMAPAISSPE